MAYKLITESYQLWWYNEPLLDRIAETVTVHFAGSVDGFKGTTLIPCLLLPLLVTPFFVTLH